MEGKVSDRKLRVLVLLCCLLLPLCILTRFTFAIEPDKLNLASIDLSLSKTTSQNPVIAGEKLVYTLTVSNNSSGPAVAKNVILSDTLPGMVRFDDSFPSSCIDGDPVLCFLGNIGPDMTQTVLITVVVDPSITGTLTNTAEVFSTDKETGPKADDNISSVSISTTRKVDLEVEKISEPASTQVGTVLTYTIVITNYGPSTAFNVNLIDTLPPEVEFGGFINSPTYCNYVSRITCFLKMIPPGVVQGIGFTVTVKPTNANQISNVAFVFSNEDNDTSLAKTSITVAEIDLFLDKRSTKKQVLVGDVLTYSLTISNKGPSIAYQVNLTDYLPAELTFGGFVGSYPNCVGGLIILCNWNSIPAGIVKNVEFTTTVNTGTQAGDLITNVVRVTGYGTELFQLDNESRVVQKVIDPTQADLKISSKVDPRTVLIGEFVTYTISITNEGPSLANQVIFTDYLPVDVSFGNIVNSSTGCGGPPVLTCTWNSIAPGLGETVIFTATVNPSVVANSTITNIAEVNSNQGDFDLQNNESRVGFTAIGPDQADLQVNKNVNYINGWLSYTVVISNNGPSTATQVVLTDYLPGGVTFEDFIQPQPACSSPPIITCTWGAIPVWHIETLIFTASINSSVIPGKSITNHVNVTAVTGDWDLSNNDDYATYQVPEICDPYCSDFLPIVFTDWPVWERVGKIPGGMLRFYDVASCDGNYLAGSEIGIYSLSGGSTLWKKESITNKQVRGVTFVGQDCNRAYATALSDGVYSGQFSSGIWTWQKADINVVLDKARDVVVRDNVNEGYFAVYVSGEFPQVGIYWAKVPSFTASHNWQPAFNTSPIVGLTRHLDSQLIFAATWGGGIFSNVDDDNTWTEWGNLNGFYAYEVVGNSLGQPAIVGTTSGAYCWQQGEWLPIPNGYKKKTHSVAAVNNQLFFGQRGVGVLTSIDGCRTWSTMNNGLEHLIDPDFEIRGLFFDEKENAIYAATTAGIWRWPLSP